MPVCQTKPAKFHSAQQKISFCQTNVQQNLQDYNVNIKALSCKTSVCPARKLKSAKRAVQQQKKNCKDSYLPFDHMTDICVILSKLGLKLTDMSLGVYVGFVSWPVISEQLD